MRAVYTHKPEFKWLASGDRPAFFQLKTMLQGVDYPDYPGNRTYYPNYGGGLGSFFGLFGGGPSYVPQRRPIYRPASQPYYGGPFGEPRSRSSARPVDRDYPYRGQRY
jgi:hypothetical protein